MGHNISRVKNFHLTASSLVLGQREKNIFNLSNVLADVCDFSIDGLKLPLGKSSSLHGQVLSGCCVLVCVFVHVQGQATAYYKLTHVCKPTLTHRQDPL